MKSVMNPVFIIIMLFGFSVATDALEESGFPRTGEVTGQTEVQPIKRLAIMEQYEIIDGEKVLDRTYASRFNRQGEKLEEILIDDRGNIKNEWSWEHEYWDQGALKSTTQYWSDGSSRDLWEYDDEGMLIKQTTPVGSDVWTTRYRYDDQGREVLNVTHDKDGELLWVYRTEYEMIEGRLVSITDRDGEKSTATYHNENNLPIRQELYEDGVLQRYWIDEYNEYGDVIRIERYSGEGELDFVILFNYTYR